MHERIEGGAQAHHAVDLVGVEHVGEILELLDADAVLAGDRAAHLDAQPQDAAGQGLGAFERARFAAIKEDQRMQIAVAGVEDVGARAGRLSRAISPMRRRASPSRRRGTTPSCTMKSGERRPTALKALLRPFQMARRSSASRAGRISTGLLPAMMASRRHAVGGDGFARAFEFDDEDGFAAGRILGVDGGDGGLQGQRVHDLDRAGQQAAGDDGGDGVAGLFERAVAGQHGVEALGLGQQLQGDLQRDAEEAFAAVEQAAPVRADVLAAGAAPLDDLAGGRARP